MAGSSTHEFERPTPGGQSVTAGTHHGRIQLLLTRAHRRSIVVVITAVAAAVIEVEQTLG